MKTESLDEIYLRRKLDAYARRNMQGILQFTPRDQSAYQPTYDEICKNGKNHRYHGFPEHNFMKSHQPVTGRDALSERDYPGNGANIPYGENVPITQTDPRPFAGSLNDRSSAELRKLRRHQIEAENDLLKYKNEKLRQLTDEKVEQKRDMDMLRSYDPYGRPGGGAPMLNGHKKNKFTEEEVSAKMPEDYGSNFGRPGAGAPLRTDSGRIRTEIAGDPLIRFHQGKTMKQQQAIKESMRYVTNPEEGAQYQKQLDKQVADRALADQEARIYELRAELDMLRHDPYGRPGAGAPNKSQSGYDIHQNKTWHRRVYEPDPNPPSRPPFNPYGNTDNIHSNHSFHDNKNEEQQPSRDEAIIEIEKEPEALPRVEHKEEFPAYGTQGSWGTGTGYPHRDVEGNARRKKWTPPQDTPHAMRIGDNIPGGAGAPMLSDRGEVIARLPITMRKNDFGDSTIQEQIPGQQSPARRTPEAWFPFGKAGAGAPIVDKDGKHVTTVYGRMHHERDSADERRKQRAAREYISELKTEMVEQRRNRDEDREYQRAPVGEMARVIREGQVGKPKRDPYTGLLTDQHLPMTDVTKLRVDHRSMKTDQSRGYHTDLSRAAEERYRNRELDKLKEKQRGQQHQQVMDGFWGRPGGGAQNPAGARYHDAQEQIYSPRKDIDAPRWEDTKDLSHIPKPPACEGSGTPRNKGDRSRRSVDSPWKFKVRDTTDSTHRNQYEFQVPREPLPKKSYKLLSPYAQVY